MIKEYTSINYIENLSRINGSKDFNTKEEAQTWAKENEVYYTIIYIVPNRVKSGYTAYTRGNKK